jgi:hypothetical protein
MGITLILQPAIWILVSSCGWGAFALDHAGLIVCLLISLVWGLVWTLHRNTTVTILCSICLWSLQFSFQPNTRSKRDSTPVSSNTLLDQAKLNSSFHEYWVLLPVPAWFFLASVSVDCGHVDSAYILYSYEYGSKLWCVLPHIRDASKGESTGRPLRPCWNEPVMRSHIYRPPLHLLLLHASTNSGFPFVHLWFTDCVLVH